MSDAEGWVTDLRVRLVEAGHDRDEVDGLIEATLARFGSARLRSFVPILVERSVRAALLGGGTNNRLDQVSIRS